MSNFCFLVHLLAQVPYSDIVCKRVVLSCDAVQNELYMRFKIKLQEEYQKKKGQSVTAWWVWGNPHWFEEGRRSIMVDPASQLPIQGLKCDKNIAWYIPLWLWILVFYHDGKVMRATSNPHIEIEYEFPLHFVFSKRKLASSRTTLMGEQPNPWMRM